MRETSFSLAFRTEVVVPVEVEVPTFKTKAYDEDKNKANLAMSLDLLEEKRNEDWTCIQKNKESIEKYYNFKVKQRRFS